MRHTLLYCSVLFLLLAPAASLAQNPHGEIHIDLPALYKQIDEAVEKSPQYIAEHEQKINEKKKILSQTDNDEQRLMLLMELSNMYEPFNGDSSQVYTEYALKAAHDGGFKEIEGICKARQALPRKHGQSSQRGTRGLGDNTGSVSQHSTMSGMP